MPKSPESYRPTWEEIKKAEETMTPKQERASQNREGLLKLREMGKKGYEQLCTETAEKIFQIAKQNEIKNKIMENTKHSSDYLKDDIESFYKGLERCIVPGKTSLTQNDIEKIESEFPGFYLYAYKEDFFLSIPTGKNSFVSLKIPRPLEMELMERCNDKEKKSLELISLEGQLDDTIKNYGRSKEILESAGIDLNNPNVFE